MEFPRILEKWIVAYAKLSDREYEFIVRDFPVSKVRIRADKMETLSKYYGQANYIIKRSGEEEFTTVIGKGETPQEAIMETLNQMLNQGKVTEAEINNYFWVVLH